MTVPFDGDNGLMYKIYNHEIVFCKKYLPVCSNKIYKSCLNVTQQKKDTCEKIILSYSYVSLKYTLFSFGGTLRTELL